MSVTVERQGEMLSVKVTDDGGETASGWTWCERARGGGMPTGSGLGLYSVAKRLSLLQSRRG